MKHTFEILKSGKVATTVWANPETKELYPANRNSFGYNAIVRMSDEFYAKYGKNLKHNQGKSNYKMFYYSQRDLESIGFRLVKRGEKPLWT